MRLPARMSWPVGLIVFVLREVSGDAKEMSWHGLKGAILRNRSPTPQACNDPGPKQ